MASTASASAGAALPQDTTDLLFGIDPQEQRELSNEPGTPATRRQLTRHDTRSGCLTIGSAVLPEGLRAKLKDPPRSKIRSTRETEEARLRRSLFAFVTATAIEEVSGVAKTDTLRRSEVTIPLRLRAMVTWSDEARPAQAIEEAERQRIAVEAARWPATLATLMPMARTAPAATVALSSR